MKSASLNVFFIFAATFATDNLTPKKLL